MFFATMNLWFWVNFYVAPGTVVFGTRQVTDFGISKNLGDPLTVPNPGALEGTVEQWSVVMFDLLEMCILSLLTGG